MATGYTGTVALTSTDPHAALPSSYTFTGSRRRHSISFSASLETAGHCNRSPRPTQSNASLTGTDAASPSSPRRRTPSPSPAFPATDTAGTAGTRDGHGLRRLWQHGHRLHRHRRLSPAPTRMPCCPPNYAFTAADTGTHQLLGHPRNGRHPVDHRHRHRDVEHHRHRVGITVRPAAATDADGRRLPHHRHRGHGHNVTVTAYDAYGNVATGYTGTVAFTSTDRQRRCCRPTTPSPPPTRGRITFSVTLETAGTQSITATDTATSSITGTQSGITVRRPRPQVADDHRVPHHRHGGHGRVTSPSPPTTPTATWPPATPAPSLHQHRPPRRPAADYTVHRPPTRARIPSPSRSKPPGTQSITATDTADVELSPGTENGIAVQAAAATNVHGHRLPGHRHCRARRDNCHRHRL